MNLKLAALGKLVKLKDGERFTLESGVRDAIACDPIRATMVHPDGFDRPGPGWTGRRSGRSSKNCAKCSRMMTSHL